MPCRARGDGDGCRIIFPPVREVISAKTDITFSIYAAANSPFATCATEVCFLCPCIGRLVIFIEIIKRSAGSEISFGAD